MKPRRGEGYPSVAHFPSQSLQNHQVQFVENLTKEALDSQLAYNPETGVFHWNIHRSGVVFGGEAGTVDDGYIKIMVLGKFYRAHNLVWLTMTGALPPGLLDHEDRNSLNNRWENLRLATRSQNNCNQKTNRANKSGVKGVFWDAWASKWKAQITFQHQVYRLGSFIDIRDAIDAIRTKRIELHQEFAHHG